MASAAATVPIVNLTNSRYTDIRDEPIDKLLVPINGYQNEPLSSLEEVCTPISHLFTDLEENVSVAKQNCQYLQRDTLTLNERAAVHLYTMQFQRGPSLYVILNQTLRSENRRNLSAWFKFLKLFMTALYKMQPTRGTVWRGTRGVDLSPVYKTGRQFAWWGVSSCTAAPDVLDKPNFLGKTGLRTLFAIDCWNGKSITDNDNEREVILMPGTYFEVIGQIDGGSNLHIIHLKEIRPPFPLIKAPFQRQQQPYWHDSKRKRLTDG
jgi:hypothetical protein